MNHRQILAALGAGVFGLSACAHNVPVEGGGATTSSSVSAPGTGKWSGRIASVTQNRADVAQSTRDNSYGSAEWTPGTGPTLSTVNLVFTYAGEDRELYWAVVAGSCGVAALPLIPMSNFPELSIGSGGRAQVNASLPIDLPSTGSYHIDIYRDHNGGAESLVGCGNLRYSH